MNAYTISIIVPLAVAVYYRIIMILYKDQINNWLDVYAPPFVTRCTYCRAYNFGVLEGLIWGVVVYATLI
jgi:hypothetical protein